MARPANSDGWKLRYYRDEREAFKRLDGITLPLYMAAGLAEELARLFDRRPLRYVLSNRKGTSHWYVVEDRALHLTLPHATALEVIHEVAHLVSPYHDTDHATAMCLLAAYVEGFRGKG